MIYKLRSKMKLFTDWFFMAYFLPLAGCVAMGISSTHIVYKLCFSLGLLFLIVKIWLTDYEKHEIIAMLFIMVILGCVFYRTKEKSLIITIISIFGCKDVDIIKVLKYTLLVYAIGVAIRMGLSWLNILPGKYFKSSKSGAKLLIYDYGFSHPNSAYNHILMISLMIVAVWRNKLLWYHYVIMTIMMFAFYNLFYSRTGAVTYIVLCILLISVYIAKNNKIKKKLGLIYALLPLIMASISYLFVFLYPKHIHYLDKLNKYLTRRIELSYNALSISGVYWFGSTDKSWINKYYVDNAYINLLINFGGFLIIICIISYLVSAIYYWKNEDYITLILFACISIYAFMEYSPVNVTWNPILLFIANGIFKTFSTPQIKKSLKQLHILKI